MPFQTTFAGTLQSCGICVETLSETASSPVPPHPKIPRSVTWAVTVSSHLTYKDVRLLRRGNLLAVSPESSSHSITWHWQMPTVRCHQSESPKFICTSIMQWSRPCSFCLAGDLVRCLEACHGLFSAAFRYWRRCVLLRVTVSLKLLAEQKAPKRVKKFHMHILTASVAILITVVLPLDDGSSAAARRCSRN